MSDQAVAGGSALSGAGEGDISSGRAQAGSPLVYIIILNYNGPELTLDCVDSVLKIDYPNFKVIVVDNASADDSVARFRAVFTDPRIELIQNASNEGYAGGNNRGIERALAEEADYVFILNNDTIADPGCLCPLVRFMEEDRRTAVCGGRIFNVVPGGPPSGEIEREYSLFTASRAFFCDPSDLSEPREVDHVRGTAMLLRSDAVRRIKGFDTRFFLLWEDTDLCYRARALGYKVCLVPSPGVLHLVSQTLGKARATLLFYNVRNRAWFVRRHGNAAHRIVFALLSWAYFYPRTLGGIGVRGDLKSIPLILRAIWEAHFQDLDRVPNVGLSLEGTKSTG